MLGLVLVLAAHRTFEQHPNHRLSVRSAARLTSKKEMPLSATGASAAARACRMLHGCHQFIGRTCSYPLCDSRYSADDDRLHVDL